MQICNACSTSCPESSGHFCPECGAVLASMGPASASDSVIELVPKPKATPRASAQPPSIEASAPVTPASSSSTRGSASAMSLVGQKVDGFAIEGVVGGGAFGTVYRGRQLGLDRIVAIKVPTMEIASDPIMAKRFAREARSAARVNHPGVVSIYQIGELPDGRPYLAMQLLEGEPLDRILAGGPVPVERALGIARQIASALSETHAAEVVHRDLKPTNIMWRQDRNGDDRLTLVDFGIAVCRPGNADATRLTSGGLIGTPHYMSPEQAHGEMVDARADIYALGCLLFELLTGTTPFDGSGFEVLLAHLGRPPPRPSDRNANIPESVDQLVLAMMAKRPDERIATADEVVEQIDEILDAIHDPDAPAQRPVQAPRVRRKTAATRREGKSVLRLPPDPTQTALDEADDSDRRPGRPTPAPTRITGEASTPVVVPLPGRAARVRWMALGALLAIALCAGALVVLDFAPGLQRDDRVDDRDPATIIRREIFRDDGETIVRVWVPDPFVVGRARLRVELRNKLGGIIHSEQLIVTVEAPDQRAIGITARPRQDNPEQFGFSYDFKTAGTYRLRVFTPEDPARRPSTFEIDLAVAAK